MAVAIVLLATLSFIVADRGGRHLRNETARNLKATIDLISAGIEANYQQVLGSAEFVASSDPVIAGTQALLALPKDVESLAASHAQAELRLFFSTLIRLEVYAGYFVVGPSNMTLASDRDPDIGDTSPLLTQQTTLARAWAGQSVITLPQRSDVPLKDADGVMRTNAPMAFAITPIRDAERRVIAVLALRLNPAQSVYRPLRAGQSGQTGEAYLFDSRGTMLSESRFTEDLWSSGVLPEGTPSFGNLKIRLPDSRELTTMASAATSGFDGLDIDGYLDYRGSHVVGAWKWLKAHQLGVAVEINAGEVFSGTNTLQHAVYGVTLLAGGLLVMIISLSQRQSHRLEQKVAERTAELHRQQEKLRTLFDRAPNGLITLDESGIIGSLNRCALSIFGIRENEAIGKPLGVLFIEPLPELAKLRDHAHIEINGRRGDGQLTPIKLSISQVEMASGTFRLAIVHDISDFKRMEHTMREEITRRQTSEMRQRLLLDTAGEGIFGLDSEKHITFINPAGASMLGYQPDELLGRRLFGTDAIGPTICSQDHPLCHPDHGGDITAEATLRCKDGREFSAQFTHSWIHVAGINQGSVVVFSDISKRKQTETSLLLAENVFQHITEGIVITDTGGKILRVNRALCGMVGFTESELIGREHPPYRSGEHPPVFYQQLWDTLQTDGFWEGEIWNKRRNGELFPTWQTIVAINDGGGSAEQFVSVTRDITEQRRSEQRIHRLAYFDNLTGLPNRELFFDRFDHAIQRAQRLSSRLALLFLDLDRFKNVNDSLGHPVGDQLLKAVASRLKNLVRGEDTIARLGGDEFTILLESVTHNNNVVQVAQKVVDALSNAFDINEHELHIGTSVGISLYPTDGDDATTLVKHADAAMYQAKAFGRNNFQFYSASMSSRSRNQIAMETRLHRAIHNDEFILHYQPQFDRSGRVIGVEALIRWQDPVMGLIPPGQFIPLAEETGLIVVIGEWALRTACAQMRLWQERGAPPIRISVNLAGPQIMRGDIVSTVASILEETDLAGEFLELEITETFVMDHVDQTVGVLSALRDLGVRIAIDDFGTGHSSLATLKQLPADTLKIDRAFVRDIPDDKNDIAIARAILAMAKDLDLKTVAEGVETEAQKAFLRTEGCDYYQGFLFARPLPAEAVEPLWRQSRHFGDAR